MNISNGRIDLIDCFYYLKDSELVKLIIESIENERTQEDPNNDLNVRLHDSNISNETIYEHLRQIDFKSAQKLHPNDRRKMIR